MRATHIVKIYMHPEASLYKNNVIRKLTGPAVVRSSMIAKYISFTRDTFSHK